MNIDIALNMIDEYLLSDCTDVNWRNCLNYVKWLIVHDKELLDSLAKENEYLRDEVKAVISGQETLQNYHHNATELAYKNGYEAGVKEFAERVKLFAKGQYDDEDGYHDCEEEWWFEMDTESFCKILDNLAKELIGGADDE